VTWRDTTIDYAELERRAATMDGWLRSVGAGRDTRVVLFMDNRLEYLVAMYPGAGERAAATHTEARNLERRATDAAPFDGVDHIEDSTVSDWLMDARPRMRSDARSAIISTAAVVFPDGTSGMTDASTTRRPATSWT
jgi:hypothetical protein